MPTTPSILVCLAHGNDAIEITTFLTLLPRAGIDITLASVEGDGALRIDSPEGLSFTAQCPLSQAVDKPHDLLLLVGGEESCLTYASSDLLLESITQFAATGRYVAAMSHVVPMLIDNIERFQGANVTCLMRQANSLRHLNWQERRVVNDPRYLLLTGQGPLCAIDMALKIIELLLNKEQAHQLTADLALPIGIYNYQE